MTPKEEDDERKLRDLVRFLNVSFWTLSIGGALALILGIGAVMGAIIGTGTC